MSIENLLAMQSDSGEILVSDKSDDFIASFRNGEWIADDVFEMEDLAENFYHILDETEVLNLLQVARGELK